MKIGILTFHNSPSHGAFLQAYAFSIYLKSLGHDVEVIDYMPDYRKERINKVLGRSWSWKHFGMNRGNLKMNTLIGMINKKAWYKEQKHYLPLFNRRYNNLFELKNDPPNLDVCFLGSDQIWNIENTGGQYDGAYFGDFGSSKMLRIAYAASFGKKNFQGDTEQLKHYLSLIDRISVREKSAVKIIQSISPIKAEHVVDPTFLITQNEYPQTPIKIPPKEYLLVYLISQNPEALNIANSISKKLKIPIINANSIKYSLKHPLRLTPGQWISIFRSARYIVTDSFHGIAFSIIFQKDFTAVKLTGRISDRATRLVELLQMIGLMDRFAENGSDENISYYTSTPIDWYIPNKKLDQLISKSKKYIYQYIYINNCNIFAFDVFCRWSI